MLEDFEKLDALTTEKILSNLPPSSVHQIQREIIENKIRVMVHKKFFDELIKAGFTEKQAIQIVCSKDTNSDK